MKPGDNRFREGAFSDSQAELLLVTTSLIGGQPLPRCREVRWTSAGERLKKTLTEIADYPELLSRIKGVPQDGERRR